MSRTDKPGAMIDTFANEISPLRGRVATRSLKIDIPNYHTQQQKNILTRPAPINKP